MIKSSQCYKKNVYCFKQLKRMCGFKGTNEGQDQLVSCTEGKEEKKDEVERCGIRYPKTQINGIIP